MKTTASDYQPDGMHFACAFESGTISGAYWITLMTDNQASERSDRLPIPHVTLWHLTSGFAATIRGVDPRDVIQKIQSGIDQPYLLLARFPSDICVYENSNARSLAHFVREVHPARDDLDAAEHITRPGPPVRDLTYVVAPIGRSRDWELTAPVRMAAGNAEVHCARPDDLRISSSCDGEGFMVLAITRCIGWSASIDGRCVPIHAADGPFMGIRVPQGEHEIHLTFRPVLMWAGTCAACFCFAGAWIGTFIAAIYRRRTRTSEASKTRAFNSSDIPAEAA